MKHSISENIVWVLSLILVASITIFESYTWGKYILIFVSFLIILVDALKGKGKYFYRIDSFQFFLGMMTVYTLLSSLWAISRTDSITRGFTFFQILICMCIIYNHYIRKQSVYSLISVVKWASYCISIYSFFYYGLDFVMKMIVSSARLDNSYTNVNTIGMLAAVGIIIQLDECIRKKRISLEIFFWIPSFVMVIATQSRKALLILIIGIFLVIIANNISDKKKILNIVKVVLIIVVGIMVVKYLSSIEVFSGINKRMVEMFSFIAGSGHVDHSTILRQKMIMLGWSTFKAHPLVGIGIGCPHILANQTLSFDAYLHNGFVEILAGGGIIGFILYYSSYIYILYKLFKYRKYKDECYNLCVILTIIFLFRDYAMVSMYSKMTYFYFMIFFIYVENLKKRKRDYYSVQK